MLLQHTHQLGTADGFAKFGLYVSVGTGKGKDEDEKSWGGTALKGGVGLAVPAAAAHYGGRGLDARLAPADVFTPGGLIRCNEVHGPCHAVHG